MPYMDPIWVMIYDAHCHACAYRVHWSTAVPEINQHLGASIYLRAGAGRFRATACREHRHHRSMVPLS